MRRAADYRALYGTSAWRKTSRLVVLAAGGRCQITPGCRRPATTADHIVSAWVLAQTGRLEDFFALDNLRAACRSCNSRRGAMETNARYRGVPRARRVTLDPRAAATAWAERYEADMARLARERERRPMPRIH